MPDEDFHEEPEPGPVAPAVTVPATPPVPSHPRSLVRRAQDVGLTEADMTGRTSDQLEDIVYYLTKQQLAEARRTSRETTVSDALDRHLGQAPAPEPPKDPDQALGIDWGKAEDGTPYTAESYSPVVANAIRENARLKREVDELKQFRQGQEQKELNAVQARIEKAFAEHDDVLGKGTRAEIKPESAEYARRMAVLREVDNDKSHRSLKEKIDRAREVLFGAKKAAPLAQEKPLSRLQQQWTEGGLARPTQRSSGPEPNGVKKATKTVGKLLDELDGGNDGVPDADDFLE